MEMIYSLTNYLIAFSVSQMPWKLQQCNVEMPALRAVRCEEWAHIVVKIERIFA